ncbi:MAG: Kazal-type serine protease inhibitor domain-containing protein [Myxococcota bacterium]
MLRRVVTCSFVLCIIGACAEDSAPPPVTGSDQLGQEEGALVPLPELLRRRHRCHEDSDCKTGQTCEKEACGAEVGVCIEKPVACPDIYRPVCGCDGKTYGNNCDRRAAGVDLLHEGECTKRCDGFAGLPCPDGEVCIHEPGTCDVADDFGRCVDRPEACPDYYSPVCGCDGKTYGNRCEAIAAGMSVDHRGQCITVCETNDDCADGDFCHLHDEACGGRGTCEERPEVCPQIYQPVCGCDGQTYPNECHALGAGTSVSHAGPCAKVCDGIAGIACDDGQFCDHPAGECDVADGQGTCVEQSDVCPLFYRPVCGCDDKTYGNDCERISAGVQKDHDGACQAACKETADCPDPDHQLCKQDGCGLPGVCVERPIACTKEYDPVCGCDGQTYGNACEAWAHGVTVASQGECFCGGLIGHACGEHEFCDWAPGGCDIADNVGQCVEVPAVCPDVWMPVCGCDGKTYSSDCDRLQAGVEKDRDGACEPPACHDNGQCRDGEWCARATCDAAGTCQPKPEACPDVWMPVCGCDGKTYSNKCDAAANGVPVKYEGECSTVCGGIIGATCPDGQFCDPYPGQCDFSDGQGECVPQGDVCPALYDPVCGCDGKTYSNDCVRIGAGVGKDHDGACECQPVACDLFCRYGFQHDAQGCDICACNPGPDTCCDPSKAPDCAGAACCGDGEWHCPAAATDLVPHPSACGDVGEGKVCAACCNAADEPACFEGATCCASGKWACNDAMARPTCDVVGHECGCPGVMCDLYCPWGFQTGADGCEICACNPPPGECCNPADMPGNNGNPLCFEGATCCGDGKWHCNDGPGTATCGEVGESPMCACPEVLCATECPNGYVLDAAGCNTCECKPGPECPPLCDLYCRYGNKVDEKGCELCACNPAPTCCDATTRPTCPGDAATCCDDGRWSCDASASPLACIATGEVCKDQCPGVMCTLYCEYGFEVGPDGCEVCDCKAPPASTCCDAKAEPPCQNGGSCCADGHWACARLDGSSGCDQKGEVCPVPVTDPVP